MLYPDLFPVISRRESLVVWVALLSGALVLALVLSLVTGAVTLPLERVLHVLFDRTNPALRPADVAIVWDLRLARALLAVLVGAGLAGAGAAFQGLFRNPLADPFVIGASGGASLGATLAIIASGSARRRVDFRAAGSLYWRAAGGAGGLRGRGGERRRRDNVAAAGGRNAQHGVFCPGRAADVVERPAASRDFRLAAGRFFGPQLGSSGVERAAAGRGTDCALAAVAPAGCAGVWRRGSAEFSVCRSARRAGQLSWQPAW